MRKTIFLEILLFSFFCSIHQQFDYPTIIVIITCEIHPSDVGKTFRVFFFFIQKNCDNFLVFWLCWWNKGGRFESLLVGGNQPKEVLEWFFKENYLNYFCMQTKNEKSNFWLDKESH